MLRDKRFTGTAQGTLIILVLARRVEFGVVAGARGGPWRAGSTGSLAIDNAPGITALQALALTLQALPVAANVARMRVLVADSWLAAATVPWSGAMRRPEQARAQARARLAQAGCAPGPGDVIRQDSAPFGAPRLALGYPAELMGILALAASRSRARLASVLPLSVAGWAVARRHRKDCTALALADTGMLVVARTIDRGARIQELTVRSADADARAIWQRLCLREPQLAALDAVAWLDLAPDAAAAPPAPPFVAVMPAGDGVSTGLHLAARTMTLASPFDAIGAPPPWSPLRAAVLAGTMALAATAAWQAVHAARSAQAMQAALDNTARTAAPVQRAVAWSAAELPRVAAVNMAVRELNLPFDAILRALAPAPDLQVAVLGITTVPGSAASQASTVKIFAEARTRSDMARYASFVAGRKPFTGAYLTEHDRDETAPEQPYRFTLEATWSDR